MTFAGGQHHKHDQDDAGDDVVLARGRFLVSWSPGSLVLFALNRRLPASQIVMMPTEARELADMLVAAAELEEAA